MGRMLFKAQANPPTPLCAQGPLSLLFLWQFSLFFFFPASKVNATLLVAVIHSAPLLFWCRADGRQGSAARRGREPLRDAAPAAREKLSKSLCSLRGDAPGQGEDGAGL